MMMNQIPPSTPQQQQQASKLEFFLFPFDNFGFFRRFLSVHGQFWSRGQSDDVNWSIIDGNECCSIKFIQPSNKCI